MLKSDLWNNFWKTKTKQNFLAGKDWHQKYSEVLNFTQMSWRPIWYSANYLKADIGKIKTYAKEILKLGKKYGNEFLINKSGKVWH